MVWIFRLAHCQWWWWLWWWLWWFWCFCWCWWQIVVWMVSSAFLIQLPQLPTSRHSPCILWSSHSQSLERQPLPKVCQDVSKQQIIHYYTGVFIMMSRDMSHDFHQVAKKYLSLLRFILIYDLDFDLSWLQSNWILVTFELSKWRKEMKKKYKKMIRWKSLKLLSSHTCGSNLGYKCKSGTAGRTDAPVNLG